MLDFTVLGLELLQLFTRNGRFFAHNGSISVEKSNPCA
jgi:predicted glutamine amidotransferase